MFKFKGVTTCVLIALLALLAIRAESQSHHIAQGDFDRDGDVDFADFLVFSNNYGKPITQQTLVSVDTVTVRDTITVTNILDSEAGKRAGRMLGYWYLNYEHYQGGTVFPGGDKLAGMYEYKRVFIFNHIDPEPNAEGEFAVHGRTFVSYGIDDTPGTVPRATVTYSKSQQRYVLEARIIYKHTLPNGLYDMECTFYFEDEERQDMYYRLNGDYKGAYPFRIVEPTVKVESIVAIGKTVSGRRKVMDWVFTPINDGLRRISRYEFMEMRTDPFGVQTD